MPVDVALAAPAAVGAYLIGAFPTAAIVARSHGRDVRGEGSGNPGTSNVYRLAGRRAAAIVLLGDLAKGAVTAGAGIALGGRPLGAILGAAAVLGHCFPPTGRRGGKGVASAGGALIVLFPLVAGVLAALWFAIARLARKASLASLAAATGAPIGVALIGRPGWEVAFVAGLSLFVVSRHARNVARLVRGEERSLEPGESAPGVGVPDQRSGGAGDRPG